MSKQNGSKTASKTTPRTQNPEHITKDYGSVSLHLTTEPRETDGVKDQSGGAR